MRDEKEERKKQARSNKQTRQSNTAHPRQSLFLEKMSCLRWDSNPRHSIHMFRIRLLLYILYWISSPYTHSTEMYVWPVKLEPSIAVSGSAYTCLVFKVGVSDPLCTPSVYCSDTHTHTHIHTHTHTSAHTHKCTHTQVHTHIHTHTHWLGVFPT